MKSLKIVIYLLCCVIPSLAYSQLSERMSIYPLRRSSREDSITIIANRVTNLIKARQYFEKTYLKKELVFIPATSDLDYYFQTTPYLRYSDLLNFYPPNNTLKNLYSKEDKKLKKRIKKENRQIKADNRRLVKQIKESPQTQEDLTKLRHRSDYELLFAKKDGFLSLDEEDPRLNIIQDSIRFISEQILLGKPHSIDGYINSINYNYFDFNSFVLPELISKLLEENLKLNISIIKNDAFRAKIKGTKINYQNIPGYAKLWVTTDLKKNEIFISPYLIRAIFNISLYQIRIFRRAEAVYANGPSIRIYFRGKSGASADQINKAYFSEFLEYFSKNIFFVIGHELAHIYLQDQKINAPIEEVCDAYAAHYYLAEFKTLDIGVFETLLYKSIESNELDFWGKSVNKTELQRRYRNLIDYKLKKKIENIPLQLN